MESRERGGAVAAALRQRRVPVHRRESRGAQSGHRRNTSQPVDRRDHRRIGRHQQRHGVRQGAPGYLPERRHPDGAAPRVRMGRVRRWLDRGPRRIRHQLQPPRRRPVRRVHRRDQPDRQPAVDVDRRSLQHPVAREPSERDRWSRTRPGRSPCTPGASACSASCRGACWPTWPTSATPCATRSRSMPGSPTPISSTTRTRGWWPIRRRR